MHLITAAGAAAAMFVTAAHAEPASRTARDYRAWHDAARDVYCLELRHPTIEVDPRPSFRGVQCRSASRWSMRGITFASRRADAPKLAHR